MSNPCKSERQINYDINNIPTHNIDGICVQNLQYNAGIIREYLNIGKVSKGITSRFDEATLSEDLKDKIKLWRNRQNDRKEFYGYLNRNMDIIIDGIESNDDSGVSKQEIEKLGDIDGILFHTHPIYKDLKIIGPPSDNDIEMLYLDAIRTGKNKINMVFAEEGIYLYCLYPEAFARITGHSDLIRIINFEVSEHLNVIFKNIGMKDKIEFVLPNINKEQYIETLRTIGVFIDFFEYDSIIKIPIFDEINISNPITDYQKIDFPKKENNKQNISKFKSRTLNFEDEPRTLNFEDEPRTLNFEDEPRTLNFDSPEPKKIGRRLFEGGNYKNKYLKYKTKYLELKKQII